MYEKMSTCHKSASWHVKAWQVSWWISCRFNKDSTRAQRWLSKANLEQRLFWKKQIRKKTFFHSCRTEMNATPVWRHICLVQAANMFPGSRPPHLTYICWFKGDISFFFEEVAPHCAIILLYCHLTSVISCFLSSGLIVSRHSPLV